MNSSEGGSVQTEIDAAIAFLKKEQSAVVMAVFVVLMAILYYPTVIEFLAVWNGILTYAHGFIVAPLSFGLMLLASRRLDLDWKRQPIWFVAVGCLLGLSWTIAYFSATQFVQQLALIGLVYIGLGGIFGRKGLRAFVLPIAVLVLVTPVWDILITPLVNITTAVTTFLLTSIGRTAYIEADTVYLSSGVFRIEGGCSGLHFVIVGQVLALVGAHIYLRTMIGKVSLLVAIALITMSANWVRVFIIILAGDLTNMEHFLVTVDHYYFGWLVFGCMMFPILLVVRRIGDFEYRYLNNSAIERRLQSLVGKVLSMGHQHQSAKYGSLFLALVLFGWPVYAYAVVTLNPGADKTSFEVPAVIKSWHETDTLSQDMQLRPEYIGATAELWRAYERQSERVLVYANRYARQEQGRELIGYFNRPFATSKVISIDVVTMPELGIKIANFELINSGIRRAASVIFIVGNAAVSDKKWAKILSGVYPLVGNLNSGAIIVSAICNEDCISARKSNHDFLEVAWPFLAYQIRNSRNAREQE